MNSMCGEGLKDGQGHGLSFSRKRGVTRPRSAKVRPSEDTQKMEVKDTHERGP